MTAYVDRARAHFTVTAGQSQVVNCLSGPSKIGLQAVGGTPTVQGTMSEQSEIDGATATWVSITLTNGQAIVDNAYTALKFSAVGSNAKCAVIWVD